MKLPVPLYIPTSITDDPRYSELSPLFLLQHDVETTRMELVPVNMIVQEEVVIDENHAKSLAESMSGSRGQISPMTVRARRLEGSKMIHYDVIDGFHRAAGLMLIGRDTAKSVVVYGCSDEELFDLRVLAANSVRSVQFARVAKWMQNSFKNSEWANKGLSLSQIFGIAVANSSRSNLGLTPQEIERAKEWVAEKAKKWNRPIASIYQDIRSVEQAAPDIVAQVRIAGGGHGGKGVLSPARFKTIVTHLAYEENFDFQRKVVKVVVDNNILAEEAGILAREVDRWRNDPDKLIEIFTQPKLTIESALKESIQTPVANGNSRPGIIGRIEQKQLPILQPSSSDLRWWRSFLSLSSAEKNALISVFDQGMSLDGAAYLFQITHAQFFNLIQSGIRKYSQYLHELDRLKKQE